MKSAIRYADVGESGKSIMNLYDRRKLISVPLFITGFFMILGGLKAEAALLKDIRIGEYEGFTRIVFELDTPGNAPHLQPQSNGMLAVSFDATQPNLNRKIPVDRSKHVKELKIWHRGGRLSTIFRFDFDHFRFETFPLDNPPRIALDIHPFAAKPVFPAEPSTREEASSEVQPALSGQPLTGNPKPDAASDEQASRKVVNPLDSKVKAAQPLMVPKSKPESENRSLSTNKPANDNSEELATNSKIKSSAARTQPKSNRLQFYLVIALVVITIVILALLLVMLLARHRWVGDKDVPNVNEYLKNQDQRIASINARIQEQLKRYEEA